MINWSHYPNFTEAEFACQCGCGKADMDPAFMGKLQQVRTAIDMPMRITSGYRCPDHNDNVSSTGRTGPHTTGRACDIGVQGADAKKLLSHLTIHFSGIGIKQKGSGRFIHVDDLAPPEFPRPNLWSY